MYPHRIRLRGPWAITPLDPPGTPCRVKMPTTWAAPGHVRCMRHFGYPGRLDDWERVWLLIADVSGQPIVELNGHPLTEVRDGTLEVEITDLLRQRNLLEIEVTATEADTQLWSEVYLEIRCAAYLRGVQFHGLDGSLHVTGEVAGTAADPLELYVLVDNAHVGYAEVQPGLPFDLATEARLEGRHEVRVELVNGATVWHVVDELVSG